MTNGSPDFVRRRGAERRRICFRARHEAPPCDEFVFDQLRTKAEPGGNVGAQPVATLAAIAFVLSYYPAFGQEAAKPSDRTDCEKLSWRVDREHDWFADKNLPRRASGARLRRIDRAVDLSLRPARQVDLFLPPDVKPRPESFSGEVTFFGVPKPGLYQVTLSAQATIDVFENGARLKATGSTDAKHCPGVFGSVRYELAPGDLVLVEVTNVSRSSIKVAFAEAEAAR